MAKLKLGTASYHYHIVRDAKKIETLRKDGFIINEPHDRDPEYLCLDEEKEVFVEVNSVEDILDICRRYDECVVLSQDEILIYDDYIE